MISKERVLTTVAHQEPDRVPIQIYMTPEIQAKLMKHFGHTNPIQLLETLGVDFRTVGPAFSGHFPPLPQGCDHVDEWGVGYIMFDHGHGGSYPEPHYLALAELNTMDDVEAYPWPKVENHDFSQIEAQCEAVQEFAVCTGGAGIPDIVNSVGRGRGMEQVLIDIVTEDPVGLAIIDKRCDFYYELCRKTLEAANGSIDILCLGEDTGNQNGPMFPPAVFDAFFRPRIQRFIDLAHEFGCKAMMHSCGDTSMLQGRFVEMGLDILDAMQPEPPNMDPERIKREYGEKLTLCGLISTQQTLPFGTVEECRAEARHRLDVIARHGGYIFAPAHNIQANNPIENILAIYEEALNLERGSLSTEH